MASLRNVTMLISDYIMGNVVCPQLVSAFCVCICMVLPSIIHLIVCILCVCVFLLEGIQSDCEGAGGRESMRYLVEQAFPLRQCDSHNLKHSSCYKEINPFDKYISKVRQIRLMFRQIKNISNFEQAFLLS